MNNLQTLDYAAVAIYMILVAVIGLSTGRYVKNIGDYFRGGNAISWLTGGLSNFMTMFSTFIFVAYAGIAYQHGLVALTVLWCTVPTALFAAGFLAHRWRRAGLLTPVEFLETRFNAPVRQALSWVGVFFRLLDNMVRLYAIGLFISAATPLSLESAVLMCGFIVALYTVAGGLWAVVVTDAIQFVILFLATLILLPLSIEAAGGWTGLRQALPDHLSWFNGPKGQFLFLLAYYVMILIKYNGNWAFIQRFYSVRDEDAGRKLGVLTAFLFLTAPAIFLLPSLAARAVLPDLPDPEMAYVSISLHLLPGGIMGVMIAAMFAATMSSLSSEYNVTAGVLTRDIYQRLFQRQDGMRETLLIARIMTLGVGLIVMIGAMYIGAFGGAFEANKLFTGLFAIPMVVPLVFGILLSRPKPAGAMATVILGLLAGLTLNTSPKLSWEAATLLQIAICLGVFLSSAFLKPPNVGYQERVRTFFAKLRTPITEMEKPAIAPTMKSALARLYGVAMACTGVLFTGMSLPSLHANSGRYSLLAGLVCLALALLLWRAGKQQNLSRLERTEPLSAKTQNV
jgi:SSS family solute:Na+ symporter